MKHLKGFNEGHSSYTDVWVVIKQGDTDIDQIYLDKDEAEKACVEKQDQLMKYFRNETRQKYVVVSLDGAIDIIKDSIRDEENYNRNYY